MEESEVHILAWELVDLATHLRQERLFTISEQENLHQLNNKVAVTSTNLCELAWITWQQRISINKLTGSRPDCSPTSCCHAINALDNTRFIEARKILGHQESAHCTKLLEFIRHRPVLLAQCLSVGDNILPEKVGKIVDIIISGLYGCSLLADDKAIVLKLLLHLTKLQLINSDDPRRLMRHKSCAFVQLYSSFHEGLYSATLFLTAALHAPIMSLLMEDEKFLDIDPDKTSIRFTSSEKIRMFGIEGTPEYAARIQKYREWTVNKLVSVTNKFIQSICENIHCFPSSVCWLVRHMYKLLTEAGKLPEKEVFAICSDLIFTSFICPAIINPEAYGIVDITISYVARFNLIQIATILQMILMQKFEPIEPKTMDLYSHFDNNNLSTVMNVLLEDTTGGSTLDEEPCIMDSSSQLKELLQPPAAYLTSQQLSSFVNFLQLITASNYLEHDDKQSLLELLSHIPAFILSADSLVINNNNNNTNNLMPFSQSPSPNSTPKKSSNILTKAVSKAKLSASLIVDDHISPENNNGCNGNIPSDHSNGTNGNHNHYGNTDDMYKKAETVLIFTFSSKADVALGLLREEQVLKSCHVLNTTQDEDEAISNHVNNVQPPSQVVQFSLSHSQDEGVSEAASNHSEESSMELETEDQNDNLSDMISANVSGRGSPNISGRDTPSSQIAENYDAANAEEVPAPTPPPRAVKQTRFDLDDKFGKFEIKNMMHHSHDETVSLVSDTWSTDVLASDSENIEQNHSAAHNILMNMSLSESNPFASNTGSQLPDISETASEAWSTDVVASDSDRVTEVDTDDTASVARSDLTTGTRSEIESRGEPDTNEDILTSQTCLAPTSSSTYSQEESSSTVVHSVEKSSFSSFRHTFASAAPRSTITNSSTGFTSHTSCIKSNVVTVTGNNTEVREQHSSNVDGGQAQHTAEQKIIKTDPETSIDEKIGVEIETNGNSADSVISENVTTVVETPPFTKTVDVCDGLLPEHSGNSVLSNGSVVSIVESSLPRSASSSASSRSPVIKSISFDKTAEKGDKDLLDEDGKTKRSFFKNIKLAFKKPRAKPFRFDNWNETNSTGVMNGCPPNSSVLYNPGEEETSAIRFSLSELPKLKQPSLQIYPLCDTSEDILAKYRPKSTNVAEFNNSNNDRNNNNNDDNNDKTVKSKEDTVDNSNCVSDNAIDEDAVAEEFEAVFDNVKRKLRLVLSTAEIQQLPCPANNNDYNIPTMSETWCQHQNILVAFLQSQLAEAINLKDRPLIAHLHETLRCVRAFDNKRCWKLLESLKGDYKNRALYLSYLMRCRQTLLSAVSRIERLINRIKCEQSVCKHFLTLLCVRLFMHKWESQMIQFATEFQKLKLSDEKNDFLNTFLNFLYGRLEDDPTWQGVTEQQLEQARTSIERIVISRVYFYAMYPNGDGDISRDQVLHEHMRKLSKIITPDHKDLKITPKYHNECPWPSAQEELIAITAFKTPQDKLKCVLRCTQTIMNLLSFVSNTVPSADHLVPVLVYVLIKANPPSLLSTIQYINSFYSSRLYGEEHYWWIQFCSAVEFIKTMDYGA